MNISIYSWTYLSWTFLMGIHSLYSQQFQLSRPILLEIVAVKNPKMGRGDPFFKRHGAMFCCSRHQNALRKREITIDFEVQLVWTYFHVCWKYIYILFDVIICHYAKNMFGIWQTCGNKLSDYFSRSAFFGPTHCHISWSIPRCVCPIFCKHTHGNIKAALIAAESNSFFARIVVITCIKLQAYWNIMEYLDLFMYIACVCVYIYKQYLKHTEYWWAIWLYWMTIISYFGRQLAFK